MPMSRTWAGSLSMRLAPKRISPPSSSLKPAIMRSRVVLPQPDGPSRVKNSPCSTVRVTLSTARTVPKVRLTPAMTMPLTSARFLQRVLDLLHGLGTRGRPLLFVVVHELDRGERRQAARQLREVEVAARRAAEGCLQDRLAHILAVDVVDEDLGVVGVGPALDHAHTFHRGARAVRRVDHFHGRAVRRPEGACIFERDAERILAVADALEHQRRAIQYLHVLEELRHLL